MKGRRGNLSMEGTAQIPASIFASLDPAGRKEEVGCKGGRGHREESRLPLRSEGKGAKEESPRLLRPMRRFDPSVVRDEVTGRGKALGGKAEVKVEG